MGWTKREWFWEQRWLSVLAFGNSFLTRLFFWDACDSCLSSAPQNLRAQPRSEDQRDSLGCHSNYN